MVPSPAWGALPSVRLRPAGSRAEYILPALALASGLWLVSTRLLPGMAVDLLGDGPGLLYAMLACLAVLLSTTAALGVAFLRPKGLRGGAGRPGLALVIQAVALGAFLVLPLVACSVQLEFRRVEAAREEVVRRVADGTLVPTRALGKWWVRVPRELPGSVSGDRRGEIIRHEDGFDAVFVPLVDVRGGPVVFVYSSRGDVPRLGPDRAGRSAERVSEHWFVAR